MTLHPFQQAGVAFLRRHRAALLSDSPGLGKTCQALSAAGPRLLVLCPGSASGVWRREAALWRPDLAVRETPRTGELRYPRDGELVLCSPHRLGRWTFFPAWECDLVADEAHGLKGATDCRLARQARNLAAAVRQGRGRVWLLTATPLLHRPDDLLGLLRLGDLLAVFGGERLFRRLFGYRKLRWGHAWGVPDPEVAVRLARFMLKRTKEDVLSDLPPKRHADIWVPLSNEDSGLDHDALRAVMARGLSLYSAIELARIEELPSFHEVSRARRALATAKIPALIRIVCDYERRGEPLVVGSSHRAPLDVLALRLGWGAITGETSPRGRAQVVEAFQAGRLRGVAVSEAGGVAVTLTRACEVVVVSDPWSPMLADQLQDRVWRIGQHRPVTIHHLRVDHPLERRIMLLHAEKRLVARHSVGRV